MAQFFTLSDQVFIVHRPIFSMDSQEKHWADFFGETEQRKSELNQRVSGSFEWVEGLQKILDDMQTAEYKAQAATLNEFDLLRWMFERHSDFALRFPDLIMMAVSGKLDMSMVQLMIQAQGDAVKHNLKVHQARKLYRERMRDYQKQQQELFDQQQREQHERQLAARLGRPMHGGATTAGTPVKPDWSDPKVRREWLRSRLHTVVNWRRSQRGAGKFEAPGESGVQHVPTGAAASAPQVGPSGPSGPAASTAPSASATPTTQTAQQLDAARRLLEAKLRDLELEKELAGRKKK
jgi:hypothetical protein